MVRVKSTAKFFHKDDIVDNRLESLGFEIPFHLLCHTLSSQNVTDAQSLQYIQFLEQISRVILDLFQSMDSLIKEHKGILDLIQFIECLDSAYGNRLPQFNIPVDFMGLHEHLQTLLEMSFNILDLPQLQLDLDYCVKFLKDLGMFDSFSQ